MGNGSIKGIADSHPVISTQTVPGKMGYILAKEIQSRDFASELNENDAVFSGAGLAKTTIYKNRMV
jgi:hypothetical protein